MPEHRVSQKQHRLLTALLSAPSISAAARQAKMSDSHARKLMNKPAFRDRVDAERNEASGLALLIAEREMAGSVLALVRIRDDPKVPAMARCNACGQLLQLGNQAASLTYEAANLKRLEALSRELQQVDEPEQPALAAAWTTDNTKEKNDG